MKRLTPILLINLFLFLTMPGYSEVEASEKISGSFTAVQSCQAYQSLRKRTNPGKIRLNKGLSYRLLEKNVPSGATWYRIQVDQASPTERWVYFECGEVDINPEPPHPPHPPETSCNTPGQADSFVFAVSWQPAFCESHKSKPECGKLENNYDAYAAGNFTLHGLWPNKDSCDTHYGFCGSQKKVSGDFCNYPKIDMTEQTFEDLEKVMPSAEAGSCLQRHEWYKHGTCQLKMTADQYFELAIDFTNQFNQNGMASFMQANVGKTVAADQFYSAVDQALGDGAHERMRLGCKSGNLVDIYMRLPKDVDGGQSLKELLAEATTDFSTTCGESFRVDSVDY